MNLIKKTVGFVAGSALALSLAAGAVAAPESATANLVNDPAGACFVSAASAAFNFGTWTWNGSSYDVPSMSGNVSEVEVDVTQDISSQPVNCYVTAAPGDLTLGMTTNKILAGSLMADVNNASSSTATISTATGNGFEDVPVEVTLNSSGVLSTLPPGTYSGVITITASKNAP